MRLLLVGGGHAMLPTLAQARAWVRGGVDVTLVNDVPELWYSGMTPEWLGRVYRRSDVTIDLEALCAREGVAFAPGRAVALDRDARQVRTADGRAHAYDLVAFDIGAVNPSSDSAAGAVQTKPLHAIEALGAWLDRVRQRSGPSRLVIVGGGAAGVEVALNVTARPDLDGRLAVTLIAPDDALLIGMPRRIQRWATGALMARDVDLRFGETAESADAAGVHLARGETVLADRVLWATGSVGAPLFAAAGLARGDRGFAAVTSGLRAQGDARVFVAGDAALVEGHESLRRIGVHAVKQGPVLRDNLGRCLEALRRGRDVEAVPLRPFRPYPVAPLVVSTGRREGWFVAGPIALRGRPVLRLKHVVDRRWMAKYASRLPSYASRWDLRAASSPPLFDRAAGAGAE